MVNAQEADIVSPSCRVRVITNLRDSASVVIAELNVGRVGTQWLREQGSVGIEMVPSSERRKGIEFCKYRRPRQHTT